MSAVATFLLTAGCILRALCEVARYALRFVWALLAPKAMLAARVLAAESQLAIELNRSGGGKRQRRQFPPFRLLCVALSKVLERWEDLAHLMKPETVKRWHTKAFRLFWRSRPGRPPVSSEMQQLIRRISRENPLWGPDRIRDTLFLLGYDAPCTQTICKYMVKPRKPRPQSTNWLPFLRNHLDVSWAIDFFTVNSAPRGVRCESPNALVTR
jgi:putative transposase